MSPAAVLVATTPTPTALGWTLAGRTALGWTLELSVEGLGRLRHRVLPAAMVPLRPKAGEG